MVSFARIRFGRQVFIRMRNHFSGGRDEYRITAALPGFNLVHFLLQGRKRDVRCHHAIEFAVANNRGRDRGQQRRYAIIGIAVGFNQSVFQRLLRYQIVIALPWRHIRHQRMNVIFAGLIAIDEVGVTSAGCLIGLAVEFSIPAVPDVFFEDDRNGKIVRIVAHRGFLHFITDITIGDPCLRKRNHAVAQVVRHIARVAQLTLNLQCFTLGDLL